MDLTDKVQMRSRRRENMNKEVRTVRGVFTHTPHPPQGD